MLLEPIQIWRPTLSNLAMEHQRGSSFINWPNDSNVIRDKIFFVQYKSLKNNSLPIRHSYDHCQSDRQALAHFSVVSLHSHPRVCRAQNLCRGTLCDRIAVWDGIDTRYAIPSSSVSTGHENCGRNFRHPQIFDCHGKVSRIH